jgi:hypothetical protein
MESPILERFFDEWFDELQSTHKMTIHDVLQLVIEHESPDQICIQEVSHGMMSTFENLEGMYARLGYGFVRSNVRDTKTIGLILSKI